jgi:hypothetical protein
MQNKPNLKPSEIKSTIALRKSKIPLRLESWVLCLFYQFIQNKPNLQTDSHKSLRHKDLQSCKNLKNVGKYAEQTAGYAGHNHRDTI